MRISISRIMPGVTVIVFTLLAALPWGLPSEARFLLPLLPYTAIHYWAVRRPHLMPEWLVFLSGLATDVLTHGPLGFWSLIFLLGFIVVQVSRPATAFNTVGRWLHFCTTLGLLSLVQWLIASAYFMDVVVDWRPLARSAIAFGIAYPFIALLFRALDRLWLRSDTAISARGA